MSARPYEHSLGTFYLTLAPAHLDHDSAALALLAHLHENTDARVRHALACRTLALTGDDTPLDAYFAASDIGPDNEFTRAEVAAGRAHVEQGRMLTWMITGEHRFDTEDD